MNICKNSHESNSASENESEGSLHTGQVAESVDSSRRFRKQRRQEGLTKGNQGTVESKPQEVEETLNIKKPPTPEPSSESNPAGENESDGFRHLGQVAESVDSHLEDFEGGEEASVNPEGFVFSQS